jgi:hypothetical protein
MTTSKQTPAEFFYEHAWYSHDPKTQTPEQGRRECAGLLAKAEQWGNDEGLSFEWEIDQGIDSSSFDDDPEPWALWCCLARDASGEIVASLSGIDFGRDVEPWGQAYRRVVEAELALEACPEL